MVKVQLGEPCNPGIGYEKSIKNTRFNFNELEAILHGIENNLDELCQKLDESYSMFDYKIILENGDYEEEYLCGGMDLSVIEGRKYSLPEFQKEYQKIPVFDLGLKAEVCFGILGCSKMET